MKHQLIITGAPKTGKTTLFEKVREEGGDHFEYKEDKENEVLETMYKYKELFGKGVAGLTSQDLEDIHDILVQENPKGYIVYKEKVLIRDKGLIDIYAKNQEKFTNVQQDFLEKIIQIGCRHKIYHIVKLPIMDTQCDMETIGMQLLENYKLELFLEGIDVELLNLKPYLTNVNDRVRIVLQCARNIEQNGTIRWEKSSRRYTNTDFR